MLRDKYSRIVELIEDKFVCYNGELGRTSSGHYLFNPDQKEDLVMKTSAMYRFDLPGMASIIQVHLSERGTDILKTHIVYQDGQITLQKQLMTQIQIYTSRALEVSYTVTK